MDLLGKEETTDMLSRPLSRTEAVLQQLRIEILGKELEPGAPIRDAEIATRMGVSITPVREAVAVLVHEGLVEVSSNQRRRVVELTKKRAQELMDLLGMFIVAAVDRLPEDFDQNASVVTAAEKFAVAVTGERNASEKAFVEFVEQILIGADNDELRRTAMPVVDRALSMIRLYNSDSLLPMWSETFQELSTELEHSPSDAANHLKEFFVYLVNEMEHLSTTTETNA